MKVCIGKWLLVRRDACDNRRGRLMTADDEPGRFRRSGCQRAEGWRGGAAPRGRIR